jgi:hypothetical protein
MAALSQYVSFPPQMAGGAGGGAAVSMPQAGAGTAPAGLEKGMHQEQVRTLLGNPTSVADTDHDGIQVHSETYAQGNSFIHAEFVNGVLVRYSVDVH